ncbi:MAG TPA: hypothetical protein VF607_05040 [Verrucomicrobiae bacterium]
MNPTIKALLLLAAVCSFTTSSEGQTVVWKDDFDQNPLGANSDDGSYGAVAFNFTSTGYGSPLVMITNNLPDNLPGDPSFTHSNNCAFLFTTDPVLYPNALNFGLRINRLPVTGNTNTSLRAYFLNFDIAVQGTSFNSIGGFVAPSIGVYGMYSGEYYGDGAQTNVPVSFFPAAGTGYQHVSVPLASFGTANAGALNPTDSLMSFFFAAYMAGHSYPGTVEIDLANMTITMSNTPPPPPPTLAIVPAKPGLRVFAQDHTATYNQEGFGTVDLNQSWVGVATPSHPVSYAITLGDFDTANNYTLYVQFLQNGDPGNPYGVYFGNNALVWSITHQDSGFTTAINWKTNAPTGNENNNALSLTTTSTNGRGTWILKFTSDTDGTVYAPDGTSGTFSLDPAVAADFANPLVIDFGTAPNTTAGFGQWITFNKIAITNVVDGDIYDDFTKDSYLDTGLWNPGFSFNSANANNAGSVFLVSTNTPYWVNWTVPDDNFTLATSTKVEKNGSNWFTPNYYGTVSGVTNTLPQLMGGALKWTLIPRDCLPTADGTVGGPTTGAAFFRLQNPPPSQ